MLGDGSIPNSFRRFLPFALSTVNGLCRKQTKISEKHRYKTICVVAYTISILFQFFFIENLSFRI
jgi:hypothetical protein